LACAAVCLGITWKAQTLQLFDIIKQQLLRVREAKFGGVVFTTDPYVLRAISRLQETQPWMASVIDGLTSSHLSLLALAADKPNYSPHGGQATGYRELRSRGLIVSRSSIGKGGIVEPTPLGKQILDTLRTLRMDPAENVDQGVLVDADTPRHN